MTISLNTLLRDEDIDPASVLVMRHQPYEPQLRAIFPWLALAEPDLYNAFQSAHNPRAESALSKTGVLASFIAQGSGKALFVGLFKVLGSTPVNRQQWLAKSENVRLMEYGMLSWTAKERTQALWFDLKLMESYRHWSGRLIIGWPKPDRSWYRWAARNEFPILAIHEENVLEGPSESWDRLSLSWSQLALLPRKLRDNLAQWRGIYLITDISDDRQYIGSAYGAENILGRWLGYARSGHGGNKLLRQRNQDNFVFSILQRLSPDSTVDEVVTSESSWKLRLRTRAPDGLNEN